VGVVGDSVAARDSSGRVVDHAVSSSDGSFALRVPAGTYSIVEGTCGTRRTVSVTDAGRSRVTITIPNSC
jgi:hypothetical protein